MFPGLLFACTQILCPVPYIDNLVLDPDLAFALKVALRHAASKAAGLFSSSTVGKTDGR